MKCPHCHSDHTQIRPGRTELGYQRFRKGCHREFNKRTGTPFNRLQYPSDVACLVVLWRLGSVAKLIITVCYSQLVVFFLARMFQHMV
jgi:transposase-like protein